MSSQIQNYTDLAIERFVDLISQNYTDKDTIRILDLGCGNGLTSRKFLATLKSASSLPQVKQYVAIDGCQEYVQQARDAGRVPDVVGDDTRSTASTADMTVATEELEYFYVNSQTKNYELEGSSAASLASGGGCGSVATDESEENEWDGDFSFANIRRPTDTSLMTREDKIAKNITIVSQRILTKLATTAEDTTTGDATATGTGKEVKEFKDSDSASSSWGAGTSNSEKDGQHFDIVVCWSLSGLLSLFVDCCSYSTEVKVENKEIAAYTCDPIVSEVFGAIRTNFCYTADNPKKTFLMVATLLEKPDLFARKLAFMRDEEEDQRRFFTKDLNRFPLYKDLFESKNFHLPQTSLESKQQMMDLISNAIKATDSENFPSKVDIPKESAEETGKSKKTVESSSSSLATMTTLVEVSGHFTREIGKMLWAPYIMQNLPELHFLRRAVGDKDFAGKNYCEQYVDQLLASIEVAIDHKLLPSITREDDSERNTSEYTVKEKYAIWCGQV